MIPHLVRCGVAALVVAVSGCGADPDVATGEPAPSPAPTPPIPPTTVAVSTVPVATEPLVINESATLATILPVRSPMTQAKPARTTSAPTSSIVVYPDTPCSEWYPTAMAAGFTHDEWMHTVARVMWAESRCDPNADNGVCCIGLMQIHRGVWDCASFDPYENLVCARHVQRVQGWSAWVTY